MSADEQAIRKLIDDWMQASARGDLDTLLTMLSEDVVFMTVNREPFGKQEFAAQSRALQGARIEGRATPVEIKVLGDWAYLRNRLEVKITPPHGDQVKSAGYTLTILRSESGGWVIARDANLMPR
jgi:uncharacterized protein (TIGR02246 family)